MIISFTAAPTVLLLLIVEGRLQKKKNIQPTNRSERTEGVKEKYISQCKQLLSSTFVFLILVRENERKTRKSLNWGPSLLSYREIYNHVGLIVQGWLENVAILYMLFFQKKFTQKFIFYPFFSKLFSLILLKLLLHSALSSV